APRHGEALRNEVVAGVAILNLNDIARGAEAGDLVGEDEFRHCGDPYLPEPAYGSSAISHAFLTARAMRRCSCTETPVMRRARILPRSEMNLRSVATSL